MTLLKKIIFWATMTLLTVPAFVMILNDNEDTVIINLLGIAYALVCVLCCKRLMPRWMSDYMLKIEES